MDILVTGIQRSGNSAISHLLRLLTNKTLLDDPRWVIDHPVGGLAYRIDSKLYQELINADIVKAPRMMECINAILADFTQTSIVYMVRDPKDVYSSILEKVRAGIPTGMLKNHRFGDYEHDWQGLAYAFNYYTKNILYIEEYFNHPIYFIHYDKFYNAPQTYLQLLAAKMDLEIIQPITETILTRQYNMVGKATDDQSIKGPGRWQRELPDTAVHGITELTCESYEILLERCLSVDDEIKK